MESAYDRAQTAKTLRILGKVQLARDIERQGPDRTSADLEDLGYPLTAQALREKRLATSEKK